MFLFINIPLPPPRESPKWPEGPEIIDEAGDYDTYSLETIVMGIVVVAAVVAFVVGTVLYAMGIT